MQDYREWIKEEFAKRCRRNQSYSLRAFARDLEVTYSRLNEAVNYKRGISTKMAAKIAKGLGFSEEERNLFIAQVEAEHGRSRISREYAKRRIHEIRKTSISTQLDGDVFELIASWYHYAILELTYLEDFQSHVEWIARRLGLSKIEVELAIQRLLRLKMLAAKRGHYSAAQGFTASPSDIPSAGLKKHHEQILKKAIDAIHLQPVESRDFSAVTMAISQEDLPKAKAAIKRFRRELTRELTSREKRDSIYTLSVQFFRLDQMNSHSKGEKDENKKTA